jgi:hypothetical protein
MYDFTFTIVDGVPTIDKREDLSHDLNEQAQDMTRAITPEYIVQFTSGDVLGLGIFDIRCIVTHS